MSGGRKRGGRVAAGGAEEGGGRCPAGVAGKSGGGMVTQLGLHELLHVFSFLEARDLLRAAQVNKVRRAELRRERDARSRGWLGERFPSRSRLARNTLPETFFLRGCALPAPGARHAPLLPRAAPLPVVSRGPRLSPVVSFMTAPVAPVLRKLMSPALHALPPRVPSRGPGTAVVKWVSV